MKIEDHPAFVETLPRICYILGGENNPVRPYEKFSIDGAPNNPHHFDSDMSHLYDAHGNSSDFYVPFIVNHPKKIIRQPQFSEDEKALMRLYVGAGYPWIVRTGAWLYACKNEPTVESFYINSNGKSQYIAPELLPQLKNLEPFNSAEYLEGLK